MVLSDSNVRSRADMTLVRHDPKHGRTQGSLERSISAKLLYLQPGSFSASVVNVELQHLCASGVVDTLVVKSMTVPSRAKLEYSSWTPLQVELVPDASKPYATSRHLGKGDQSINSDSSTASFECSVAGITGHPYSNITEHITRKRSNKPKPLPLSSSI